MKITEFTEIIQTADETFENTPEGNQKFREFVQKVIERESKNNKISYITPSPPGSIRYGIPY